MSTKMKFFALDKTILRHYIEGCKQTIRKEHEKQSYIDGHAKGIDDALKLIDDDKGLTFVMRMAVLGLRHRLDDKSKDPFYSMPNINTYVTGYDSGMKDTIRILTGYDDL